MAKRNSFRKFVSLETKRLGLTYDEFAKCCELSRSFIHKISAGERGVSLRAATRIAKATGRSVDEIARIAGLVP